VANQHRRIKRVIRGAIKKVKSGEIPYPPPPKKVSAEQGAEFMQAMERRRERVLSELERISDDSSSAAHKKRLRLDQELSSLEGLLKPSK
jgi:hypothetical protein